MIIGSARVRRFNKRLKFSPKINSKILCPNQGFTMAEVLIAILITTLFVEVAMQAMVINAIFKVKAEREAQANFWIQEDLEQVRAEATKEAAQLGATSSDTNYCTATKTANGTTTTGYQNGHAKALSTYLDKTGDTLTLPADTNRKIVSKEFDLIRNYDETTNNNAAPYAVLKINYKVEDVEIKILNESSSNNEKKDPVIATFYAEVMPSEAFKCISK